MNLLQYNKKESKMRFPTAPENLSDIQKIEEKSLSDYLPYRTTHKVIETSAEIFRDKPAIIFIPDANNPTVSISISYSDLLKRVNQAANLFDKIHAKNASKVISYLLPNLPQTHFTLWGAEAVGIVNPLRPDLSPEQIARLLRKSGSKTLVTVGEFIAPAIWANVLEARKHYPELNTIFVIGGRADEAQGIYDFDAELAKESEDFIQTDISPNDICAYFHTSATTTPDPKLVRLTQQGTVYAAWATGTCLGFQESDVVGVGLPFFHVGAPTVGGLVPFMCGATTVLMSPMGWMGDGVISHFWEIVRTHGITITAALNFMYNALLNPEQMQDTSLRLAIAGTPVSDSIAQLYKAKGIQVADIYGSSETMLTCFNPPHFARAGSMGLRFPYADTKIIQISGGIGELWVRGRHVTRGYQDEPMDAFTQDGWFRTGDLVKQDDKGYYWFFDRAADVIHHNDGLISSLELEHLFESHKDVDRAAVIGQHDPIHVEVPVLFVTLKPGVSTTADALRQWAIHRIPNASHRPMDIFIKDTFPLNGIAKVIKPLLRDEMRMHREPTMSL